MYKRKGIVSGAMVAGVILVVASTAAACVTFMGAMEVNGHDGMTEVVGTGNSHAYCSDGRPTTAAAGHLLDSINIKVKAGHCADTGAAGDHQMPDGTYEVRFNNVKSYTFDGTYWNMTPGLGCFRPANFATTTIIGGFTVTGGDGTWTGTLGVPAGAPYYPPTGEAANICVGDPESTTIGSGGRPGLLAPYRLLQI